MLDLFRKPWVATCSETRDHLSDYIDGELEGRTLLRIRRHLERCERCRTMLASLTRTLDALRSLRASEPPSWSVETAVLLVIRDSEK